MGQRGRPAHVRGNPLPARPSAGCGRRLRCSGELVTPYDGLPVISPEVSPSEISTAFARREGSGKRRYSLMRDAAILPEVYAKSLLYRDPQLTNVFVQTYYGMYNYSTLGLK
jgi:peptide/nickel transport system substrate-binding protein